MISPLRYPIGEALHAMHAINLETDWPATCKLVTDLCRDLHTDDGTGHLYQRIHDVRASIHASGAHLGQVAIAKEFELATAAGSWVGRGDVIRQRALDEAARQAAAEAAARAAAMPVTPDDERCPHCGAATE